MFTTFRFSFMHHSVPPSHTYSMLTYLSSNSTELALCQAISCSGVEICWNLLHAFLSYPPSIVIPSRHSCVTSARTRVGARTSLACAMRRQLPIKARWRFAWSVAPPRGRVGRGEGQPTLCGPLAVTGGLCVVGLWQPQLPVCSVARR